MFIERLYFRYSLSPECIVYSESAYHVASWPHKKNHDNYDILPFRLYCRLTKDVEPYHTAAPQHITGVTNIRRMMQDTWRKWPLMQEESLREPSKEFNHRALHGRRRTRSKSPAYKEQNKQYEQSVIFYNISTISLASSNDNQFIITQASIE